MPLKADDFRSALRAQLRAAELAGKTAIDINAGELHRNVGGYPGARTHRMPMCCSIMRQELRSGDAIVSERASDGASFTARYKLPR